MITKSILQGGLAMVLACIAIVTALTSGNGIVTLAQILLAAVVLLGLIKPKIGFAIVFFSTVTIDTLKRLMILGEKVDFFDLYFILGVPLLGVTAIYLSGLLRCFLIKEYGERWIKLYVTVSCLALASGVVYFFTADSAMSSAANGGVYWLLIAIIPSLFSDNEAPKKMLDYSTILMMFVACYLFKQVFIGLADFEWDYLATGFTIESRNIGKELEFNRVFSSLNSAAVVSVLLGVFGGLSLMRSVFAKKFTRKCLLFVTSIIFFVGVYYTYTRAGWVCGAFAAGSYFCFVSKWRTKLFYVGNCIMIVALYVSSPYLLDSKVTQSIELSIKDGSNLSAESESILTLGTFNSRLLSMSYTMTKPQRWTPFGIVAAGVDPSLMGDEQFKGAYYSHDGFSDLLMRAGYVPLLILMVVVIVVVRRWHRVLFLIKDEELRMTMVGGTALFMGIAIGYIGNAAQLSVFPQNFYACLGLGVAIWSICKNRAMEET